MKKYSVDDPGVYLEVLFLGRLWFHAARGEGARIEYSKEWQSSPGRLSLEPVLEVGGSRGR